MRKIVDAFLPPHANPRSLWLVEFDDDSRIAVDVSAAVKSEQKAIECIKSAAMIYSESHPRGVLSSVVVNLSGDRVILPDRHDT
jgi:hypothetical protein